MTNDYPLSRGNLIKLILKGRKFMPLLLQERTNKVNELANPHN